MYKVVQTTRVLNTCVPRNTNLECVRVSSYSGSLNSQLINSRPCCRFITSPLQSFLPSTPKGKSKSNSSIFVNLILSRNKQVMLATKLSEKEFSCSYGLIDNKSEESMYKLLGKSDW